MLYLALFVLAASAVSTTSKPSGGNGSATSKVFHTASDDGYGWCKQWTFENDCTEAQFLASSSSLPEADEDGLIVTGECPDKFEMACEMLYKDKNGEKFGSPLTTSAGKTNGCGEAEYILLTDDCDTCGAVAFWHALGEATGSYEELEEPTCSYRESFFKEFINRLKEGELLYIGIAAAVVLVPLMCCICCCCCLLSSSPSQKVTYLSRV